MIFTASNTINEFLTGEFDHNFSNNEPTQKMTNQTSNNKFSSTFSINPNNTIVKSRKTRPPNQLPLIPSSISLHSFNTLNTTNNYNTTTKNRVTTPTTNANSKYLNNNMITSPTINFTTNAITNNSINSTIETADYSGKIDVHNC
jgi:hypothetical protein